MARRPATNSRCRSSCRRQGEPALGLRALLSCQLEGHLPLGRARRRGEVGLDDETVTVLGHEVPRISRAGSLSGEMCRPAGLGIGGRGVGLVRASLPRKSTAGLRSRSEPDSEKVSEAPVAFLSGRSPSSLSLAGSSLSRKLLREAAASRGCGHPQLEVLRERNFPACGLLF